MKSTAELRKELAEAEEREARWHEVYGDEPTVEGSVVTVYGPLGAVVFLWVLRLDKGWYEIAPTNKGRRYTWEEVCRNLDDAERGSAIVISPFERGIYPGLKRL